MNMVIGFVGNNEDIGRVRCMCAFSAWYITPVTHTHTHMMRGVMVTVLLIWECHCVVCRDLLLSFSQQHTIHSCWVWF